MAAMWMLVLHSFILLTQCSETHKWPDQSPEDDHTVLRVLHNVEQHTIPHNVPEGYVITQIDYLKGDSKIISETEEYFRITNQGDLVTYKDLSGLVGQILPVSIKHSSGEDTWHDLFHIKVAVASQKHIDCYIAENEPPATPVSGVAEHLPVMSDDEDSYSYTILSGGDGHFLFIVDEVVKLVAIDSLDREEKSKYTLTVEQSCKKDADKTMFIIDVFVRDVDDNIPMLTESLYTASISKNVQTNSLILHVMAEDSDTTTLNYILRPNDVFDIDENGDIFVLNKDLLVNDIYNLEAFAIDEAGHVSPPARVIINVDSNLYYHHKSRSKRQAVRTYTIDETDNTITELFRLGDPARTDSPLFTITDDPSGLFEVHASTGAVTLRSGQKVDYENPEQRSFTLRVTETTNTGTTTELEVQITVQNVNDEIPVFVTKPEDFLAVVPVDAQPGHVVFELLATDPDGALADVKYRLQGSSSNQFELNSDTGIITTSASSAGTFRIEQLYMLQVKAYDNNAPPNSQDSLIKSVRIKAGPRAPQFYEDGYTADVVEEVSTPHQVAAVKIKRFQTGTDVRLSLLAGPSFTGPSDVFSFELDSAGEGILNLNRHLDYEDPMTPNQYRLRLVATETTGSSVLVNNEVEMTVNVIDKKEKSTD